MSRSRRKNPVIKDKGRTDYNRLFRRVNKQRINQDKYPLLLNEVCSAYDVCDYRCWIDDDDEIMNKVLRK